jgi:hypothetical protein
VESFSVEDGHWAAEPDLSVVHSAAACAVFLGGLYCIGGRSKTQVHTLVERFDGRYWTSVAPLRVPRWATSAAHWRGKLYVVGGLCRADDGSSAVADVECFDGAKWTDAPRY